MKIRPELVAVLVGSSFFLGGCGKKKTEEKSTAVAELELPASKTRVSHNGEFYEADEDDLDNLDEEIGDMLAYEDADDLFADDDEEYEDDLAALDDEDFDLEFDDSLDEAGNDEDLDELVLDFGEETQVAEFNSSAPEIQFKGNSVDLDDSALDDIDIERIKELVKKGKKVVVHGHAGKKVDEETAYTLSKERADRVKEALVAKGIPSESIEVIACGQEIPKTVDPYNENMQLADEEDDRVGIMIA